jgi:uncharacterized membrane protein YhaH (DUF805 family)
MIMVEYYKLVVFERYAQFEGRAGRAEFWWFVLANLIINVLLQILASAVDVLFIVGLLYSLAIIIPSLAVAVRRLHDTGKSGWWLLIGLVPLVGFIVLIVFYATEGDAGPNQYGEPDPGLPATMG